MFEIDALRCPGCGSRMRILAAITDPSVAQKILECMRLPARAPPLLGLSIASECAARPGEQDRRDEPFDFDQSPPSDWDFGA